MSQIPNKGCRIYLRQNSPKSKYSKRLALRSSTKYGRIPLGEKTVCCTLSDTFLFLLKSYQFYVLYWMSKTFIFILHIHSVHSSFFPSMYNSVDNPKHGKSVKLIPADLFWGNWCPDFTAHYAQF